MVNKVYLVTPRGFCAGVEMAIKALHWLLKIYDETIYCYHEIVHNKWIVNEFQNKNVVFVESPDEIPQDAVVMLSAHGTAPTIEQKFQNKSSITINSVCPLVTKVHHEAKKFSDRNIPVIYVGHKGHDEAIGALGVSPNNMHLVENVDDLKNLDLDNKAALLAQTTLAISEWEPIMNFAKDEYQQLELPRKSDLCYATTNRQEAVLEVLSDVEMVLVVGSENSSNTNALVKMVENNDVKAVRVESPDDIDNIELTNNIAITAGASAPDHLVYDIIKKLNPKDLIDFEFKDEEEYFPLPNQLRKNISNISEFLSLLNNSEKKPDANFGVKNDRNWTATESLASL